MSAMASYKSSRCVTPRSSGVRDFAIEHDFACLSGPLKGAIYGSNPLPSSGESGANEPQECRNSSETSATQSDRKPLQSSLYVSDEAGNDQTALDRILTAGRTKTSTFISCDSCGTVAVRPETDTWHDNFSDVCMKQGFLRSEAFELGEPSQLNV